MGHLSRKTYQNFFLDNHPNSFKYLFNMIVFLLLTATLFGDSITNAISLEYDIRDTAVLVKPYSAEQGLGGFVLPLLDSIESGLVKKWLPFRKDFWMRYCFRIDSLGAGRDRQERDTLILDLMQVHFSDVSKSYQPPNFLYHSINKYPRQKQLYFNTTARPSADPATTRIFAHPVRQQKNYCVEIHYTFDSADSLAVEGFIDGSPLWRWKVKYLFSRDFIFMEGRYGIPAEPDLYWTLFFSNITLSGKQLRGVPPRPDGCTAVIGPDNRVRLKCNAFKPSYLNEHQSGIRWRVFKKDAPGLVLFDVIEKDQVFFTQYLVPFPLDSGDYVWQADFQNNFQNWSGGSKPEGFTVEKARHPELLIKETFITETSDGKPLSFLKPGPWYYLHVHTAGKTEALGYVIARLNHPSYSFGHPGNKGGEFLPSANYIFNGSFESHWGFNIYEKGVPNSAVSKAISRDSAGIYTDGSLEQKKACSKDHVRFKFRLLPQVLPGTWQLLAYARYGEGEVLTNVVRKSISVVSAQAESKKQDPGVWYILVAILAVLAVIISMMIKRRRPELKSDMLLKKIEDYINAHIAEEITISKTRKALLVSERRFYNILKDNKIETFPQFVNKIRIMKAKELLIDPDKTISQAGFETGFNDPAYFTKVFRKWVGMTPKEFREKNL
jgi:AraC-like DNA-binding protein